MVPVLDYLLERQVSPQWRGMLGALAEEFQAQIDIAQLRQLMYRVGCRFAQAHRLPDCTSTADLSAAINRCWHDTDWGFIELADAGESLAITHFCSPLLAFGERALDWTPAFLEGVYQTWLAALGAEGLTVAQTSALGKDGAIEFRLGRHPG